MERGLVLACWQRALVGETIVGDAAENDQSTRARARRRRCVDEDFKTPPESLAGMLDSCITDSGDGWLDGMDRSSCAVPLLQTHHSRPGVASDEKSISALL